MIFSRDIFVRYGALLAIASLVTTANGQVRQTGRGNALDANYQVGSGGSNYGYIPNNYAPVDTSIYAATRTRGLSSFSGRAAALSGDFQGRLGTDSISRFERQSVGIGDVLRGGTYQPQSSVYYDPYRRTLSPGTISRAAHAGIPPVPGEVSRTLQVAQKLYVNATADYRTVMPDDPSAVAVGQAFDLNPRRLSEDVAAGDVTSQLTDIEQSYVGDPDMFGVLKSGDRAKLADELRRLREQRDGDESDRRQQPLDARVHPEGSNLTGQETGRRLDGTTPRAEMALDSEDARTSDGTPRSDMRNRRVGGEELPAAGDDVFLDVLVALRQTERVEADAATADDSAIPEIDRNDPMRAMIDRPVERTKDNKVVIHRLEGRTPSTFNKVMTQARQALREGRFYRAGRQYELASMTRPRNPLAFVGRGLSSFGAGEYHSAALSIRRALELFPALMETQLDIGSLLPVKDFDIDTQMNEIEEWLTDSKADGAVRFLAAFLYKNMGRDELAKHHAEVLLEGKKASDPIYAAYAQYVLTGKKPADLEGKAPQLKESQPR